MSRTSNRRKAIGIKSKFNGWIIRRNRRFIVVGSSSPFSFGYWRKRWFLNRQDETFSLVLGHQLYVEHTLTFQEISRIKYYPWLFIEKSDRSNGNTRAAQGGQGISKEER